MLECSIFLQSFLLQFLLLQSFILFSLCEAQLLGAPDKLQFLHISLVREYLQLDLLPSAEQLQGAGEGDASETEDVCEAKGFSNAHLVWPERVVCTESGDPMRLKGSSLTWRVELLLSDEARERAVDDFVFFCVLAGNDFLPAAFAVPLNDGGLNKLIDCYKEFLQVRFSALAAVCETGCGGLPVDKNCRRFEGLDEFLSGFGSVSRRSVSLLFLIRGQRFAEMGLGLLASAAG